MGDNQGFDDQFNDGVFRTALHTSKLTRPKMWPKAVSEMRKHTSYGGQGMAVNHDTGHSDYMARRPYVPRGTMQFNPSKGKWIWVDAAAR